MSSKSEKIIIGLTGGIACGKSTAGRFFHELGWELTSTDQIVSHLLDNNDEVISEIKSRWGGKVLKNFGLDRKAIGKIVFRYIWLHHSNQSIRGVKTTRCDIRGRVGLKQNIAQCAFKPHGVF